MADDVDLDPALRSEIDRLHARLDDVDHYALLGIARAADRKEIKSAYYAHAARLHPDRHFGKKLGPYKAKMEQIFGRMTVAHDTLAASQRRAEYDAYLAERAQVLAFEQALAVEPTVAEERPVAAARIVDSTPRMPQVTPTAPPTNTPSKPPSPEEERQRREALARRLLGGGSQRRMPATSSSTPSMSAVRSSAPPAQRTPTPPPREAGLTTLITSARVAANTGDLVTASNRMRLAAKLDATYAHEAEELTRRAHAAMAEMYMKQARFEESEERWVAAALSWVKAHEGRPNDPVIAERAANALRRAKGDLHKAVKLAEQAAQMRPMDACYRVTLAEVYVDAGLFRRARSEVDHALRLAPHDATARQLSDDLRRRGF